MVRTNMRNYGVRMRALFVFVFRISFLFFLYGLWVCGLIDAVGVVYLREEVCKYNRSERYYLKIELWRSYC